MGDVKHTIRIASTRSGLSAHVIRVWEKRYVGIQPDRTQTNRRLYSEEDIEKLRLLKQATDLGCRIAHIAHLDIPALVDLLAKVRCDQPDATNGNGIQLVSDLPDKWSAENAVTLLMRHTRDLDQEGFHRSLSEATVRLGYQGMLCDVVAPLTRLIGQSWEKGQMTIPQEHAASAALKSFLFSTIKPFGNASAAPKILIATPSDQLHEIGAVMVTAMAASLGWKTYFIGSSVPALEIAAAAKQKSVHAIALSLVYPHGDPQVVKDLEDLRASLPEGFPVLVGGQAQGSYAKALKSIRAIRCQTLPELQQSLRTLQSSLSA